MPDVKPHDRLVSEEEAVEVDRETGAAIERGIRAADEGQVLSSKMSEKSS